MKYLVPLASTGANSSPAALASLEGVCEAGDKSVRERVNKAGLSVKGSV